MASPIHSISFDVEDWYQSCVDLKAPISSRVYHNTMKLLDLMDHFKVRSTLFIQTMVAETYPDLIKEAAFRGHEIATHGHSHKQLFLLGKEKFQEELQLSIKILENITGEKVLGHRAPDFSITKETPWAFEIMAQAGLQYDSSIFPIKGRRYGIPEAPRFPYVAHKNGGDNLWEVPLATVLMGKKNFPIAGGGYVRHFPLWFTHWALGKVHAEGKKAILYFHPYEIDARETLIKRRGLHWKTRFFMFRQGLFRNTMKEKLVSLFERYTFVPIREVIGL